MDLSYDTLEAPQLRKDLSILVESSNFAGAAVSDNLVNSIGRNELP